MTDTTLLPTTTATDPVGILKDVARVILAEPLRYDQGDWLQTDVHQHGPPCGTVGCVAGWVCVLTRRGPSFSRFLDVMAEARDRLEISGPAAYDLFNGSAIDEDLEYGTPAYAEAGVRHIDRWLREYLDYAGPPLLDELRQEEATRGEV
jgi:hypothetical protein